MASFMDRFWATWQMAGATFGLLRRHSRLLLFPVISAFFLIVVCISFVPPVVQLGIGKEIAAAIEKPQLWTDLSARSYVTIFAFYFANYFVIIFCNVAFTACVAQAIDTGTTSIAAGFGQAAVRVHHILVWALISATVGLLLKAVEKTHRKTGRLISSIFGATWAVLTYFVVPLIVVDRANPFRALGGSVKTLKSAWGEALFVKFSLGFMLFLTIGPLAILFGIGMVLAERHGLAALETVALALLVLTVVFGTIVSTAADTALRLVLLNYARGRPVPDTYNAQYLGRIFEQQTERPY